MSTTTQSTATASVGVAAAALVVGNYGLSLLHIVVPADVAAAALVIAGAGVHWLAIRFAPTEPPK